MTVFSENGQEVANELHPPMHTATTDTAPQYFDQPTSHSQTPEYDLHQDQERWSASTSTGSSRWQSTEAFAVAVDRYSKSNPLLHSDQYFGIEVGRSGGPQGECSSRHVSQSRPQAPYPPAQVETYQSVSVLDHTYAGLTTYAPWPESRWLDQPPAYLQRQEGNAPATFDHSGENWRNGLYVEQAPHRDQGALAPYTGKGSHLWYGTWQR